MITIPTDGDLFHVQNLAADTLAATINNSQTTIEVATISRFSPTGGFARIEFGGSVELIQYGATSGSNLTGVTRGYDSTNPIAADSGSTVRGVIVGNHHNAIKDSLINSYGIMRNILDSTLSHSSLHLHDTDITAGGLRLLVDTTAGGSGGDSRIEFDEAEAGSDMHIGNFQTGGFVPMISHRGTGDEVNHALDLWSLYSSDNMNVGAELGVTLTPKVVDGASAIAYDFRSINDLADATARVLRVQNVSAEVFYVSKTATGAPRFDTNGTTGAHFNLHPLTAAPSVLANGDLWVTTEGGTTYLRVRVGGLTESIAFA